MLKLNATTTAPVVIDLQEGILPFAGGPYTANEVVARAARLAESVAPTARPWLWYALDGLMIMPKR